MEEHQRGVIVLRELLASTLRVSVAFYLGYRQVISILGTKIYYIPAYYKSIYLIIQPAGRRPFEFFPLVTDKSRELIVNRPNLSSLPVFLYFQKEIFYSIVLVNKLLDIQGKLRADFNTTITSLGSRELYIPKEQDLNIAGLQSTL